MNTKIFYNFATDLYVYYEKIIFSSCLIVCIDLRRNYK